MGFLFPTTTVEGPQLDSLLLPKSQYGDPIPQAFGRIRLGGQVIWGLPLIEERAERTSGGKKGRVRNIEYNYYGTFAMSFARSEASVLHRIWANGDLMYDKENEDAGLGQPVVFDYRFYHGTASDPVDLAIRNSFPSGYPVPAYRDQCHIVIERLHLKEYGNRLPELTAEITFGGDLPPGETREPIISAPPAPTDVRVRSKTQSRIRYEWTQTPRAIRYELQFVRFSNLLNPFDGVQTITKMAGDTEFDTDDLTGVHISAESTWQFRIRSIYAPVTQGGDERVSGWAPTLLTTTSERSEPGGGPN